MLYNAYSHKLSKSRKDTLSYLNVMVVGSVGSGKTAFVRTFCETLKHDVIQGSFKESKPMVLKDPLRPTDELYTVSMHIEENGRRTALTIIDTPGFTTGYAVDHQLRYIAKYIDYQFERTLAEVGRSHTHAHTQPAIINLLFSGIQGQKRRQSAGHSHTLVPLLYRYQEHASYE